MKHHELIRMILTEEDYKGIKNKFDDTFLKQLMRSSALRGIRLAAFDGDAGQMIFHVKSSEFQENHTIYSNTVTFDRWNELVNDLTIPAQQVARLLLSGNIRINCTCPSFLYWGFQYILTKMDSAEKPENRPPVVRNPTLRGSSCKHMRRVMEALPFYNGDIARKIIADRKRRMR